MPLGLDTTAPPSPGLARGGWKLAVGLLVAAVVLVGTPVLLLRLGGTKVRPARPASEPRPAVALAVGDATATIVTFRRGCDRDCGRSAAETTVDGTWRLHVGTKVRDLSEGEQAELLALLAIAADGPDDLDYSSGPAADGTPKPAEKIGGPSDRVTFVSAGGGDDGASRTLTIKDPTRGELWDSAYDRERRTAMLALRRLLGG